MTNPQQPLTTHLPPKTASPSDFSTKPEATTHPPTARGSAVPAVEPFETFDPETQTILGVDPDSPPASLLWSEAVQETLDENPDPAMVPSTASDPRRARTPHRQG